MPRETVLTERKEAICTLRLNRPKVLNAFNRAMLEELKEAYDRIRSDEGIRVVVLEGAGAHFSAGADMLLLHEDHDSPDRLMVMKEVSRVLRAMRELPQPIVCKVRGVAYGIGINLALAGDFVIASHNARLCEVFVNIGAIVDGGGTYFLPRLVGLGKARELAMLGEEIDGKTAASIGLIYKSVADEELDSKVDDLADNLARKPKFAMALIKEGLEGSLDMSLKEVLEWEASHQSIALQTEEHKVAVREFLRSHGLLT